MREDIRQLLKTRPLWQKLNPQEIIDDNPPVLPVEQIVKKLRKENPEFADLLTAYLIARDQGDLATATEFKLLMDQNQNNRFHPYFLLNG